MWYKVAGDQNHNDSPEKYVVAVIDPVGDGETRRISEEDMDDYRTPKLQTLTLTTGVIKIGPKKDRKEVQVSITMNYKDAVTYNGKAVTPKYNEELQFTLDPEDILRAAGISNVKADEIFKVSYSGTSKKAGEGSFYAKLAPVSKAKSRFGLSTQQLKDLKTILGSVNKMLRRKENRVRFTINKASIVSLMPIEVKAKLE